MNSIVRCSKLAALAGAAGVLLLAACKSLGTQEDQNEAKALWSTLSGYQSWPAFEGHEGLQKGKSPHGKFVRTFVNPTGAANPSKLAFGTIIVKENYQGENLNSLAGITVMQRIEGYDPANDDWFWARFTPQGEQTHSGKVEFCSGCHFDADGDDFVFLNR